MLEKISVREIVSDHLATLQDVESKKRGADLFLFFWAPVICGTVLAFLGVSIDDKITAFLATLYSIFAALLFNFLLLVLDLSRKAYNEFKEVKQFEKSVVVEEVAQHKYAKLRTEILEETRANVAFELVLCIASLFVLLVLAVLEGKVTDKPWLIGALSVTVFAMTGTFLLTLLMILKRMYALLGAEFSE